MRIQTSYRACFSSLGCPELGLDEMAALAVRFGIAAIELRFIGGDNDPARYLERCYGVPERLAAALEGFRVTFPIFGSSLRLIGRTEGHMQELERISPWLGALGVRYIRLFDGGVAGRLDEDDLAAARDSLRWWGRFRSEHGLSATPLIETHWALNNTASCRRFYRTLPDAPPLLWDSHHTWRPGGEDPEHTWRALRRHIAHIHIKDSLPAPDRDGHRRYVLPGQGDFPVRRLLDRLKSDGYRAFVSLEWERRWRPELPPLDQALAAARAWYE